MVNIPLYSAGEIGVIKDMPPEELEPRAWSDARNVRFRDGKAMRPTMDSLIFGTPTDSPYQLIPVQSGAVALWTYSSLTNLYATDGTLHTLVTRLTGGPYTVTKEDMWHGGVLSGIPVITNGLDVPQMWISPSLGTRWADLTDWPATDRCKCIKPFKSFLVAMNIIRSGNPFGHLVKWSHPAVPGSVPNIVGAASAWDETNPALLAGEVELVDEFPGQIRDGGGMRDTFIIYKDNATWGMQFIGGNAVFRFFPIFLQSGIMSKHCYTEIKEGAAHFVATGSDFIIHDGQHARSVFSRKIKSFIFRTLPETMKEFCFAVSKPSTGEVWFCFSEEDKLYPSLAAIYNWDSDTCTIRELPGLGISFMALAPIAKTSDPWNSDPRSWDSDTTKWDDAFFSPRDQVLVGCDPDGDKFYHIEDGETWGSGYMERTGIAITGQDRVTGQLKADNEVMKLLDRVWMKSMGSPFMVSIGSQEQVDSPVDYTPAQEFIPGVTKYLDFPPANGRFLAIKIQWPTDPADDGPISVQGYDLNVEVLGKQ